MGKAGAESYFILELDGQEVRRFPIERKRTSIGRARESDVQIAVRGVSRTHAIVLMDDAGNCTLKDLGSANGTYVNGERIPGEHELKHGDVVNFLDYALRFQSQAEESDSDGLVTDEHANDAFNDVVPTEEAPAPILEGVSRKAAAFVVEVNDKELGISSRVLDNPVTTIGGEAESHIRLSGRRLERYHSLLIQLDGRLLFVRLSPVHIARINGAARMVTFLEPEDEIGIGHSTIKVKKR
jgi:pSer/pThr/pTyr-binding forkhead associated (FHA) protein